MANLPEQMAIIREVGYGCRDIGRPCLWFTTYTSEISAALQVFTGERADQIIRDSGKYDVHQMEGMACLVECDGMTMTFKRLLKI